MPRNVFYGYWVLACCFIFTLVLECNVVVFSLFIKPLQASLGWSQALILGGSTIFTVASAIAAPLCGRLVERWGARPMVTGGTLIICAGFFVLSRTTSIVEFYAGYVLAGLGLTATGPLTLTYVVSNWFEQRRGMAVGAMSTGVGLASIIFAPLVAVYLLPHFGWRTAYLVLGLVHLVAILPLSWFVLQTRPEDMGLYADGAAGKKEALAGVPASTPDSAAPEGFSLRAAAAASAFWLIGISLVFNHTHLGVLQTIFPHLREIGFSPQVAASAVGVSGAVATLGLFFFGWLCDKTGAPAATALGLGLMTGAIVALMAIGPHSSLIVLWLSIAILGFGVGSWMPTLSMLTSMTFGMASYGAIFGVLTLFTCVGAAAGPLIAGYAYDMTGSYFWAFGIMAVIIALGIPAILFVRKPRSVLVAEKQPPVER